MPILVIRPFKHLAGTIAFGLNQHLGITRRVLVVGLAFRGELFSFDYQEEQGGIDAQNARSFMKQSHVEV